MTSFHRHTSESRARFLSASWSRTPASGSGLAIGHAVAMQDLTLISVMTHERGHTYGIAHVAESTHKNLTMSTAINGKCQVSESTLGYGDVLALRAVY